MLLSTYAPLALGSLIPPKVSCAYARNVVVAPTLMTLGSVAGEPIVLVIAGVAGTHDDGDARGDRGVVGLTVTSSAVSGNWSIRRTR